MQHMIPHPYARPNPHQHLHPQVQQAQMAYYIQAPVPMFSYQPLPAETGNDFDGVDFQLLTEYLMDDGAREDDNTGNPSGDSDEMYFPTFGVGQPDDSKKKGRGRSQGQVDRRKERNRVLARKTRQRKKFFFESLQQQVARLSRENHMLKDLVRERISPSAHVLSICNTEIPSIVSACAENANSFLENADYKLMKAIQAAQRSFCITDPKLPDNPIVYAAQGFLELTKYKLDQVVGRNCRFLQGPDTDPRKVEMLRTGIAAGIDTSVCFLNYKADGTVFYNQVFVAALRDQNNQIVNYVGVQVEVSKPPDDDDDYMQQVLSAAAKNLTGQPPADVKEPSAQPATVKIEEVTPVKMQQDSLDSFDNPLSYARLAAAAQPVMQEIPKL